MDSQYLLVIDNIMVQIAKGDTFVITVQGTLCGTLMTVGDLIIAKVDVPAQTCGNWVLVEMAGAFVPYTGANQTVDLNTQNLLMGEFLTLGDAASSSVIKLRNADAGKELLIEADVAGFNNVILQLGGVGSLTAFMFSAPAVTFDKNLRFDTSAITSIYVNNGGLGLQLMGRNDISGAFGITVLDAGQLQLAASTSGSGVLIAGSAVIATSKITANSKISVIATNSLGVGVAVGVLYESKVARVAGTSFTITSEDLLGNVVGTDIRTFDWFFIEERV